MTSVVGPIPRNPFQTGKFFQELSEFVGHNPGIFMVEQLSKIRLSRSKSPVGLPPARQEFDSSLYCMK